MPTPTKGPRLGGGPAHERLMLANLATSLFEHGRIKTTEAKAKRLRPLAERLITFAKRGDLHARRQVLTVVRDKNVVHRLFAEIGPRYEQRPGGYTRITKVGPRKGDNAPMAVIELVEALTGQQSMVREAERARGTRFARDQKPAEATEAAAAATADVTSTEAVNEAANDAANDAANEAAEQESATEAAVTDTPAAEAGDQPAEGVTSAQTAAAGNTSQAEGDTVADDEGERKD